MDRVDRGIYIDMYEGFFGGDMGAHNASYGSISRTHALTREGI